MSDAKGARPDYPIHELLAQRWSPYAFDGRPVAAEDLASLFEAARWAASSYNEQPWRYLVATKDNPEAFDRILSCLVEANQTWAKSAPLLALAAVSLRFDRNGKPNRAAHHDLGLASANLGHRGDQPWPACTPDDRNPSRARPPALCGPGWLRGPHRLGYRLPQHRFECGGGTASAR